MEEPPKVVAEEKKVQEGNIRLARSGKAERADFAWNLHLQGVPTRTIQRRLREEKGWSVSLRAVQRYLELRLTGKEAEVERKRELMRARENARLDAIQVPAWQKFMASAIAWQTAVAKNRARHPEAPAIPEPDLDWNAFKGLVLVLQRRARMNRLDLTPEQGFLIGETLSAGAGGGDGSGGDDVATARVSRFLAAFPADRLAQVLGTLGLGAGPGNVIDAPTLDSDAGAAG